MNIFKKIAAWWSGPVLSEQKNPLGDAVIPITPMLQVWECKNRWGILYMVTLDDSILYVSLSRSAALEVYNYAGGAKRRLLIEKPLTS